MTEDDFDFALDKIIDVYGEKYYATERKNILFEKYRHLDRSVFLDACHFAIATNRQAPMVKEFDEAIDSVRRRLPNPGMVRSECKTCDTFGAILERRDKELYAFQCHVCVAGPKNFSGLPKRNLNNVHHLS